MFYSISQIKTFCASKSKRAGQYILGIKDDYEENDALVLGRIFEKWLMTWEDRIEEIIGEDPVVDMEKLMEDYDTLKHNAQWLEFDKWASNYKVEWDLLWQRFVGYIDNLTEDCVYDIKTSRYLSKEDWWKNMWSWMSSYDEYKLQLRAYMKLTWKTKAKIIEVAKHKYKDERNEHQVIEFELTPKLDEEMTKKYQPIVDEMSKMRNTFKI